MCFSANASFAAAGVVSVAGVAALSWAKKPSQMLLGGIPLLFALHQFAEGVLWLALSNQEHAAWQLPAMFTFLVFVEIVWPAWVPLSILAVEEDPQRRKVLSALLALGVVLSLAQAYGLRAYPVSASIAGQHIQYRLDSPLPFRWVTDIAYLLVTVLPPLVSRIKLMRLLGLILLASLVISKIFFYQYSISVWCFFAALISVAVVLIVKTGRHGTALTKAGTTPALPPGVRELYPFQSRYRQLRCGHRMHYLDEGTGPTLLMLHGNPTWSFYYRNLVLGLRDHYRCIVPDHIGCGLSDKPQHWSYGIPAHTDNLCELLTSLDLEEVTLVTHDWGGPIGYLAAIRFPGRFKRFITFNTAVSLLPLPRLLTMLRIPLFGPLVIRGLNGLLRAGLLTSVANGRRFSHAVRAGYLAPYDSWAHRVAILRFVQEIPLENGHPNRGLLSDLGRQLHLLTDRPHLVIWGLKDPIFHRDYLAAWRRWFPGSEVHAFEDAAHWVVDEAHERILPLIQAFLARTE